MSHIVKDLSGTPGVPLGKQRIMAPSASCYALMHTGKVRRGLNSFVALPPLVLFTSGSLLLHLMR